MNDPVEFVLQIPLRNALRLTSDEMDAVVAEAGRRQRLLKVADRVNEYLDALRAEGLEVAVTVTDPHANHILEEEINGKLRRDS